MKVRRCVVSSSTTRGTGPRVERRDRWLTNLSWPAASLLDVFGGTSPRRPARRLVGLGVVAAVPTAAAGVSDWLDTMGGEARVGIVHAMANTGALALYTAAFLARRRDPRQRPGRRCGPRAGRRGRQGPGPLRPLHAPGLSPPPRRPRRRLRDLPLAREPVRTRRWLGRARAGDRSPTGLRHPPDRRGPRGPTSPLTQAETSRPLV